jgi:hypothetical protein
MLETLKLSLHDYTRTGKDRFREFVSDCGGAYVASMKLDVPVVFIHQILRDEPVPDHIVDRIEKAIGPLRIRKIAFKSSTHISQPKQSNGSKVDVYTHTAQQGLREFVSICGGVYAASAKLDVPTFFVEQILRDEPVPDHILEQIEEAVGPLRMPRHDSGISKDGSPEKPGSMIEAEADAEVSLGDFVRSCGGIFAASVKLDLSTTTIKKILAGVPVSGPTIKKVVSALKAIDYSVALDSRNQTASNKHRHTDIPRLESSAYTRGVYPSTVRKLQSGRSISKPTQRKLGISSETQTTLPLLNDLKTNSTAVLANRLKELIKSDLDMFDLASKWGVKEASLKKLYEGKPVTRALIKKVDEALRCSEHVDVRTSPSAAVERLRNIQQLYKQLGTLKAVGERMGLTRARVQQLITKGSKIGLFEYNPREYPFIAKEKLIDDYKRTLSLTGIARLNKISTAYLHKLFTAYSITGGDLVDYRLEARRARCIEQFGTIVDDIGHHPNSTELQRTGKGRSLYNRIVRYWGSIDNFRTQLNIPKPRHLRPHWLDSWRQIALVKRMQHLDTLRDCIREFAPIGVSELCQKSNFGPNRARRLLALMMATGEVKRIGQLASTKYLLTNPEVTQ